MTLLKYKVKNMGIGFIFLNYYFNFESYPWIGNSNNKYDR